MQIGKFAHAFLRLLFRYIFFLYLPSKSNTILLDTIAKNSTSVKTNCGTNRQIAVQIKFLDDKDNIPKIQLHSFLQKQIKILWVSYFFIQKSGSNTKLKRKL